jgi:protein ImuB
MFACLHLPSPDGPAGRLVELTGHFSPVIEELSAQTVLCDIDGLERLIGSPEKIATAMAQHAAALHLQANIALAANPDTALLMAFHRQGVHVIAPGQEAAALSRMHVGVLPASDEFLETLGRWGIGTLGELAALPPLGLAERLGAEGAHMRLLALGQWMRPMRIEAPPENYEARFDLEHPVALLEPLLFYVSSMLNDLVHKLKRQALAARRMTLTLTLVNGATHVRTFDFPLPMQEPHVFLKQAQLDLDAHPPAAAVRVVELRLDPARPRMLQGGLFRPATPEPDKLHVTLARIAALVGPEHVGCAELLNTYRPDAYAMRQNALVAEAASNAEPAAPGGEAQLRLGCRLYRPALAATVRLARERPTWIQATNIRGAVQDAAGPWRTSGEWWTRTRWARDEWDVGLDDGTLYRIYRELDSARWFVDAMYD